jgi:hypothetical protein
LSHTHPPRNGSTFSRKPAAGFFFFLKGVAISYIWKGDPAYYIPLTAITCNARHHLPTRRETNPQTMTPEMGRFLRHRRAPHEVGQHLRIGSGGFRLIRYSALGSEVLVPFMFNCRFSRNRTTEAVSENRRTHKHADMCSWPWEAS